MEMTFCQVSGENEDVVKVDKHKPVQEIPQHVIHQGLKDSKGVGETKRQDPVFIVTQRGVECGLPFIPFADPHQMVGIPKVQLREHCDSLQRFEGRTDERQWILIFNSNVVQTSIVSAWA